MGSIVQSVTGGISGTKGAAGLNYEAQDANLQLPTTDQMALDAQTNAQGALTQQQAFVSALANQGGVQNQSNVFNQLQGIANGTGPNPAQAQLAQATGANTANQAALMAAQRGAGANVGMIARQAAQQGAANQQQAAGQAATMQAQQSLGALNQLGSLATNQVNQQAQASQGITNARQAQQQAMLNAIAAQNNSRVGQASSMNSANAGIAGIAAGGQMQMLGGLMGGAGSALGLGGSGGAGASGAASMAPMAMMAAQGGQVPMYVGQEDVDQNNQLAQSMGLQPQTQQTGPKSSFGKYLSNLNTGSSVNQSSNALGSAIGSGLKNLYNQATSSKPGGAATVSPTGMPTRGVQANPSLMGNDIQMAAAEGGKVPALVSPGEVYLDKKDVNKVAKGKDPIEAGEKIPGKPKHPGNNYANDTVPKNLESGGIVIPNKVLQSKDPHKEAAKFVSAILAKQGKLPKRK